MRTHQLHSYGNKKRTWMQAARKAKVTVEEAHRVTSLSVKLHKDPFMRDMEPRRFGLEDRTQASTVVRCLTSQAIISCEEASNLCRGGVLSGPLTIAANKLQSAEAHAEELCRQRIKDDDPNDEWAEKWTDDEAPMWTQLLCLLHHARRHLVAGIVVGEER